MRTQDEGSGYVANRYAGICSTCGSKVPAGAGTRGHATGTHHAEGQCNTKTKTYRDSLARQALATFHAALKTLYEDRGYTRRYSPRIEHADEIHGRGLLALIGGDRRDSMIGHGIRVYRALAHGGAPIYESPERKAAEIETGDYYADRLAEDAALLDLLDGLAA